MGGVNIPLEANNLAPSQPIDALQEQMRAAQLQQTAAATQGQQQQNEAQGLQLKDAELRRSLAPQFVQKDDKGKITGYDNEGFYAAMLSGGADPQTVAQMRMQQMELQKASLGLNDAQLEHSQKIADTMGKALESIQEIQDQEKKAGGAATPAQGAPPAVSPQGAAPAPPTVTPAPPQIPLQAAENPAPQPIGAAPAGTPESFAPPPAGSVPTQTEAAATTAQANAPRPITPGAQAAYHQALVRLSGMGLNVSQLPPVLNDESDLEQAEASVGQYHQIHKDQLADQETIAKTNKDAAEAEAANWKGSDGVFVNLKSGQIVHAGGNPSQQAFQEYVAKGGDPLNFASDQAAREASNPALQAAKLHDAVSLKSAEQAIADGDPRAAAQLLVNGDVAPSQLISSRKPAFAQQAFTAAQQMAPGWNAQKAEADYSVAKSPTNVGFFGSAKSLTDPGGTLDQLKAAAKDIPEGKIPLFNSFADAAEAATGSGPIAKYAALLVGVADDYSKVMGGGQGSDSSRNQGISLVPAKASPAARDAAIDGIRGAVGSQINSRIGSNPVLKKMYGTDVQPTTTAGGKIRARDPQGHLHEAPAGTALPAGWTLEQ